VVSVAVTVWGRTVLMVSISWGGPEPAADQPAGPERTIGFHGGSFVQAELSHNDDDADIV
jgi:hypothetical protein